MVGPAAKRAAVAHLEAKMGLSERRACSIVDADRKMIRYRSRRPPDAALRARLRELANERRRFAGPNGNRVAALGKWAHWLWGAATRCCSLLAKSWSAAATAT